MQVASAFDRVADEYDRTRPQHPTALYDLLGDLAGRRVVDGGAGTGIATRALAARGAHVVAVDLGPEMLRRASAIDGASAVHADAAVLPIADDCVDLLCFAQAWHWIAQPAGSAEAARVLVDRGRWAAWWSQPAADGAPWFDGMWDVLEAAFPGVERDQRDRDWGATLDDPSFEPAARDVVTWTRTVTHADWLAELATTSYVSSADAALRDAVLGNVAELLDRHAPADPLEVPYVTTLWTAWRRARNPA